LFLREVKGPLNLDRSDVKPWAVGRYRKNFQETKSKKYPVSLLDQSPAFQERKHQKEGEEKRERNARTDINYEENDTCRLAEIMVF